MTKSKIKHIKRMDSNFHILRASEKRICFIIKLLLDNCRTCSLFFCVIYYNGIIVRSADSLILRFSI